MCCNCNLWELVDPIVVNNGLIYIRCWLLEIIWLRFDKVESELKTL